MNNPEIGAVDTDRSATAANNVIPIDQMYPSAGAYPLI
jgi:hypothetical protein